MSDSKWRAAARTVIARVDAELPANTPLADFRRALRQVAWHAHQGTRWGARCWQLECRLHLARRFGAAGQTAAMQQAAAIRARCGDQVHFPFSESPS